MPRERTFKEVIMGMPLIYKLFQQGIAKSSTLEYLVKDFIQPKSKLSILDVGCGNAQIRKFLGDVNYVGVDHNPKYIAKAREANGLSDEFYVADVSEVAQLVTNKFDRILLIGVLHHLSDSQCQDLLRNCAQLLATDGHLLAYDPALIENQHPIARLLAKSDRGRFARSPNNYKKLIQEEFTSVVVTVRHDLLRVPYTHAIVIAKNN
jgi:2-polyprenyl-3-methyl-5-hydroxy-6-metoxy-1,4-benzoquinol methylase